MALLDWSMSMLGYPAHQRSATPVVAMSHMSTHAALRLSEAAGLYTGWIQAQSAQPQMIGADSEEPFWAAIAELFVEGRIAYTEGVISGTVIYVPAVPADGEPPADRSLIAWAEERHKPWVRTVDNEVAYFGNFDDTQLAVAFAWFFGQRPVEGNWREATLDPDSLPLLKGPLFEYGWTRNCQLVTPGRKPTVDLWAGIHDRSVLETMGLEPISDLNHGVRATRKGDRWSVRRLQIDCPLDDRYGRVTPPPG